MKFSLFRNKVRQILAVDLPAGDSVRQEGRAIAQDLNINRTAFMKEMGVDSELEYKAQCIKSNNIMFHAHIGLGSWAETSDAVAYLYNKKQPGCGQYSGFRIHQRCAKYCAGGGRGVQSSRLSRGKVIISVAGGIPISVYTELGVELPMVRALPNPPSQVGKGIAALAFNPHVTEDQQNVILELFDCLGDYVVVREEPVNAVMALSSPALTYYLFQSLIDAGIRAGIDQESGH